jgi:hypothetical protein
MSLSNVVDIGVALGFLGLFSSFAAGVAVRLSEAVSGHHSIPWEAKKPLIDRYGLWAVNRAEAFCPENDVACVTREAERLYRVHIERSGG